MVTKVPTKLKLEQHEKEDFKSFKSLKLLRL